MKKMMVFSAIITIIVLSFPVIMFAPWVTENFAQHRATSTFEGQWENVSDGCGINCNDCGVKTTEKALFGRKVVIEYACGLLPSDSPEFHQKKELFVSFLGTVH